MPTLDEMRRWARGEVVEGMPPPAGKTLEQVFKQQDEGKKQGGSPRRRWGSSEYKINTEGTDALLLFGKYRGKSISNIPAKDRAYLLWLLAQPSAPQDLKDVIHFVMDGGK
jgi:uncharacterized protein (DUF3820 family)